MFCNRCGLKAEGSDAFCVGCGAPLKKNLSSYDPNRAYGPEGPYGPNKGYELRDPYHPTGAYGPRESYDSYRPYDSREPGYAHPPRRSSKTPIIIAIVCIAVVLIGLYMMDSGSFRDPLIGSWENTEDGDIVTFNRDGTGTVEWVDGWSGRTERDRFTYTVRGNVMRIYRDGFFDMELEYRITGNRLILYDDWGEYYFIRR